MIGASNFPYCNLVTLCLAWGLPGLSGCIVKCSLPSSAPPTLPHLSCRPTPCIPKALIIPNIHISAFDYWAIHTCDMMYHLSQLYYCDPIWEFQKLRIGVCD